MPWTHAGTLTAVRTTRTIALLLSLAACGTDDSGGYPPMTHASPDYELGPPLRELVAGAPDDVLGISRTDEAVLDGTTFLLADFGTDRVLRLDTTFALLHAFGRSGAGPGELKHPTMALPWRDQLFVGDWNNRRFSIFDRDGNYLRTTPAARQPESYGVREDGRIVMPSNEPEHYAAVIHANGSTVPFAKRPTALLPRPGTEPLGGSGTIVLVGPGDTTHILDNEWGILLKYDPAGELRLARSLPADVLMELRDYRSRFVASFARQGRRILGMALLNSMSFCDDGSILMLIKRHTVALRVNPGDYSVRRITADLADSRWSLVRDASAALIRGDIYYSFSSSGLSAHPLLPRMP